MNGNLTKQQDDDLKKLLDQAARHVIDTPALQKQLGDFSRQLSSNANTYLTLDTLKNELRASSPKTADDAQKLLQLLQNIDNIAAVVRGQADDTIQLIQAIKTSALKDLGSPESQAAIYKSFAAGIGDESQLFEDRQPNPPPALSEGVLTMKYYDKVQRFYLAAWTGLPLPVVTSSLIKTELHPENLIPIIGLFGWRWQFAASSLADFRLGIGAIGTRETRVVATQVGKEEQLTNFNAGPQLNVGFAGFKVGVAHIVREDDMILPRSVDSLFTLPASVYSSLD